MKINISPNISKREKVARFLVGAVLLGTGHALEVKILSVIAAIPLITGYFDWCPLKALAKRIKKS